MDLNQLRRPENNQIYIASMRPVFNRKGLFSDTTENYLIPAQPDPYDVVRIRFRTAKNNIDRVLLVYKNKHYLMKKVESDECFDYYEYKLHLTEEKVNYHFVLEAGKISAVYDNRGVVKEANEYYDFVIFPGFKTPEWAKGAVMYQIYVDRFCNGDTFNDVLTDE